MNWWEFFTDPATIFFGGLCLLLVAVFLWRFWNINDPDLVGITKEMLEETPDHQWLGTEDGHDCIGCKADSLYRCDPKAHDDDWEPYVPSPLTPEVIPWAGV